MERACIVHIMMQPILRWPPNDYSSDKCNKKNDVIHLIEAG